MNILKPNYPDTDHQGDWREDLMASRDLSDHEKQGYGFLLAWFETWRMGHRLAPSIDTARKFWRAEVKSKPRKDWQQRQWAEAMRWFLHWMETCQRKVHNPVSVWRKRSGIQWSGLAHGEA